MLATAADRTSSSYTSSSTTSGGASVELDPLLKDLTEKKQIFQNNVLSLASHLKDARKRLARQEESFARELSNRQAAEAKMKNMEENIRQLEKGLEEREKQLQASTAAAERYAKELDVSRLELSNTKAAAEASAALAQSAEAQCAILLKELEEKNMLLKEHEDQVNKLGEHLSLLQEDLQARELSQKQLTEEVVRIEKEIMLAASNAGSKDYKLIKILDEVSPEKVECINKQMSDKNEEIARLKDEIRFLSGHWKHKTKDLQSQLDKHRRSDQDLKKRVLKLEFCLHDVRNQTRKCHRRRDNKIKELSDQLVKQEQNGGGRGGRRNIWESSGFKIIASVSMLALVAFARR